MSNLQQHTTTLLYQHDSKNKNKQNYKNQTKNNYTLGVKPAETIKQLSSNPVEKQKQLHFRSAKK
jgi:DNA-binding SARP family transcriptional activator